MPSGSAQAESYFVPCEGACYNPAMEESHPKLVRRFLLERLYQRYMRDPLDMVPPGDFLEDEAITRENLIPNIHYLHDRGLVELMLGFSAPMFDGARITADGIDLVENISQFGLSFPCLLSDDEALTAGIPVLIERLLEEADLCALDGEGRHTLIRDIQYLRDELARPVRRWRIEVLSAALDWIEGHFEDGEESLPSYRELRALIEDHSRFKSE
jgi:hypothetical protein